MAAENIIQGLLSEKAGYQHRIDVAKASDDGELASRYSDRIKQVDEQLKVHGYVEPKPAAKENTKASDPKDIA